MNRKISSALISVFHKDGLEPIVRELDKQGVKLYSTGGTEKFINDLGIPVTAVEDITEYPSIFGGRVKTLHPKVFGGILHRREHVGDQKEVQEYGVPPIDLVIVDLYPFEETVAAGGTEEEIIEKIDIGGIALIRGAAKNFNDVLIVSSRDQYDEVLRLVKEGSGETSLAQRQLFATRAFQTSSHYDTAIFNYMNDSMEVPSFKVSMNHEKKLRYGENPHQEGRFFGNLDEYFEQLHGKELSYNNLLDVDAAVQLMAEFDTNEKVFAILKHNNACGIAVANDLKTAYQRAFAADTLSAFGGVLITNQTVNREVAEEISTLFFEILIAPEIETEAFDLLSQKKNRILLIQRKQWDEKQQFRSVFNGALVQSYDRKSDEKLDLETKTKRAPSSDEVESLLFASKICKHSKSNTIVLAKDGQLLASGLGQTSRVDALTHAIAKARNFGLDLKGASMASDAFFPFADCVEIAHEARIESVIQPGGSVKDQLSIDFCNEKGMSMVFTGIRHFKH
ncbi:MAG: bifunctional phosphoribosylaminoimidazolecarboxamide formyltransferase/IMP cyclohydrolase [Cytophagales bacterium]|nr:bifunctional phosphoribosylaminoimidazolecarboxamide formyltransferase/IMP cyclohydrolase [Cytophagales bacterium]